MAFKAWSELTLMEKKKIRNGFIRNPHKAYENLRTQATEGAIEPEPEEPEFVPVVYNFTSYSDAEKTTEWGTGTVETTGVTSGDYTEVEVLTNSPEESFVGQKFYILTSAKTDGTVYELFTDAGTTSAEIFVTIQANE